MSAVHNRSRDNYRDLTTVFQHCREVMGEEDRVENQDHEGYRSLCIKSVFGKPLDPRAMMSLRLLTASLTS
jgi:hypothetical protein